MQNESNINASIQIGMVVLNFHPARSFDNLPKVAKVTKVTKVTKLIKSFYKIAQGESQHVK